MEGVVVREGDLVYVLRYGQWLSGVVKEFDSEANRVKVRLQGAYGQTTRWFSDGYWKKAL